MNAIRQLTKAEKDRVNELAKQRVAEWLKKNEEGLSRRVLKLICVALNDEYGFGKDRLAKLIATVDNIAKEWNENQIFWVDIDRRIKQIGLPFEDENYDEVEW